MAIPSLWRRDHLMAHRSLDIGSVRVHPLVQRASKHALADILIDPEARPRMRDPWRPFRTASRQPCGSPATPGLL